MIITLNTIIDGRARQQLSGNGTWDWTEAFKSFITAAGSTAEAAITKQRANTSDTSSNGTNGNGTQTIVFRDNSSSSQSNNTLLYVALGFVGLLTVVTLMKK